MTLTELRVEALRNAVVGRNPNTSQGDKTGVLLDASAFFDFLKADLAREGGPKKGSTTTGPR